MAAPGRPNTRNCYYHKGHSKISTRHCFAWVLDHAKRFVVEKGRIIPMLFLLILSNPGGTPTIQLVTSQSSQRSGQSGFKFNNQQNCLLGIMALCFDSIALEGFVSPHIVKSRQDGPSSDSTGQSAPISEGILREMCRLAKQGLTKQTCRVGVCERAKQ